MAVSHDNAQVPATLKPEQADLLDAMLDAGTPRADGAAPSTAPPAAADPACAERLRRLLLLIRQCPAAAPSADLTRRTLATVAEARQRQRMLLQSEGAGGGGLRFRWAELAAVVAVLLISSSLLLPALDSARGDARRAACASNLAMTGGAMGHYALDYSDQLPRRKARPGTVWWNVGKVAPDGTSESNSAHLYTLARSGYVDPDVLSCPDNAHAPARGTMTREMIDWPSPHAVSFSYQNQYLPGPNRLLNRPSRLAVLADKNPLFVPDGRSGLTHNPYVPETSPSPFHGWRGQNVLLSDGQVLWTREPVLASGDNIWMADDIRHYSGRELPAGPDDSFLVP